MLDGTEVGKDENPVGIIDGIVDGFLKGFVEGLCVGIIFVGGNDGNAV